MLCSLSCPLVQFGPVIYIIHSTEVTLLIRWFNKSSNVKVCSVIVCGCNCTADDDYVHAALVGVCLLCGYGKEACH